MMNTGWSEKVREFADSEYVQPARQNRSRVVRIRFGDIQTKLEKLGLPTQHPNQVASSLESKKFWESRGLQMCSPKGQSRKKDSVFEFRFADESSLPQNWEPEEDPLLELAGILKGAICEGVDAFVRDIRMDKRTGL
jgi:hypothetical protein